MKIGIVCPYNIYRPGGVQNQVESQATELRQRGYEVRVVTPRPQGHKRATAGRPGVCRAVGANPVRRSTRWQMCRQWVERTRNRCWRKKQFDLLHIHEPLIPDFGHAAAIQGNLPHHWHISCGVTGHVPGPSDSRVNRPVQAANI